MQANSEISIQLRNLVLKGLLEIPSGSKAIVAFAHGSGSGRLSPRNQFVAQVLNEAGFATLLMDLLEERESDDRQKVFDIDLLSERLVIVGDWIKSDPRTQGLSIGYFGASTGAGAALVAAARRPELVTAIVSRGGRPDLAGDKLSFVRAPTLFIVGGRDDQVIKLNEHAFEKLKCKKELEIVPNATHLFEEAGALERVAKLAVNWFSENLLVRRSVIHHQTHVVDSNRK